MSPFRFNFLKTVQAVAVLLRQAGESKTDNYTRVLKLLYLADRRSLAERGRPITGDRVVAMEHGPVLSDTYDLIMDRHFRSAEWFQHIDRADRFSIRLIRDPGNGELSPYEVTLLEAVAAANCLKDQWELVRDVHELPEWQKNNPRQFAGGSGCREIPLSDILEAVGRGPDREEIERHAAEQEEFAHLFAGEPGA